MWFIQNSSSGIDYNYIQLIKKIKILTIKKKDVIFQIIIFKQINSIEAFHNVQYISLHYIVFSRIYIQYLNIKMLCCAKYYKNNVI